MGFLKSNLVVNNLHPNLHVHNVLFSFFESIDAGSCPIVIGTSLVYG